MNHLQLAHKYWTNHLKQGDLAIDATCGNGHDTLFLAQLGMRVIALDIQKQALTNTSQLLDKTLTPEERTYITLIESSHASFPISTQEQAPSLIVYNLGYLPGGNKALTTTTETTLESIYHAQSLLAPQGMISITCYPGHEEGEREERAILDACTMLDSRVWHCCHHRWVNRERAPSLFILIQTQVV